MNMEGRERKRRRVEWRVVVAYLGFLLRSGIGHDRPMVMVMMMVVVMVMVEGDRTQPSGRWDQICHRDKIRFK